MKKINLIITGLVLCYSFIKAQTLYVPGGIGGIGSSGNSNVGIGVSSATEKLEVTGGNIKITNGAAYNGTFYSGDPNWGFRIQRTGSSNDYNVRMTYSPGSGTRKAGIFNVNSSSWVLYADHNATPNVIIPSGKLGISTTLPPSKLSLVGGTFKTNGLSVNHADVHTAIFNQPTTHAGVIQVYSGGSSSIIGSNPYHLQLQPEGGNVGIGIAGSNPTAKLDIKDPVLANIKLHTASNNISNVWATNSVFSYGFGVDVNGKGRIWRDVNNPSVVMTFNNGTVLIGNDPAPSPYDTYELQVDGSIVAKQIVVTTAGWADYVFGSNYKLKSLEEVEKFVNENKHLPGIPPAIEIETNGISIGEMQTKQMEKIEELYLYIMDINKKLKALEVENAQLRSAIQK